jgi:hypothetical protein
MMIHALSIGCPLVDYICIRMVERFISLGGVGDDHTMIRLIDFDERFYYDL